MKPAFFFTAIALAALMVISCNRHSVVDPGTDISTTTTKNNSISHNNLRIVSSDYSQPISLDTANKMIGSYLQSINYPFVDTTIRSLAFDADTLRNYLKDTSITAVKFYFAHQLGFLNSNSTNYGKNIGMRPGAMTIICVGINDNGAVVRNSSNGVYEHALPCPNNCGFEIDAYLH